MSNKLQPTRGSALGSSRSRGSFYVAVPAWLSRSIMQAIWLTLLFLVANLATAGESFKSIYIEEAKSQLAALTTNFPNAEVLHSITNLPAEVRERLSGTADVGEPFSSGCVREYAGDRFLTATKVNHTYIVAIEHGGAVYNWSIRVFAVNDAGKLIRETEPDDAAKRDQSASRATNHPPAAAGPAR